jgi:hypothetical protein
LKARPGMTMGERPAPARGEDKGHTARFPQRPIFPKHTAQVGIATN